MEWIRESRGMMAAACIVAGAAGLAGGCDDKVGDPASAGCTSDNDCQGALTCKNVQGEDQKFCVCEVGTNGGKCSQATDCASGEKCSSPSCQCVPEGTGGTDSGTGGTGGASGSAGTSGSGGGAGTTACATGSQTDGPITVTGTVINAEVDSATCGGSVCQVGIQNDHTAPVFYTYAPFAPSDPIQLEPRGVTIPPKTSLTVDVIVKNCSTGMTKTLSPKFFDDPNPSFGPIPITITTTVK